MPQTRRRREHLGCRGAPRTSVFSASCRSTARFSKSGRKISATVAGLVRLPPKGFFGKPRHPPFPRPQRSRGSPAWSCTPLAAVLEGAKSGRIGKMYAERPLHGRNGRTVESVRLNRKTCSHLRHDDAGSQCAHACGGERPGRDGHGAAGCPKPRREHIRWCWQHNTHAGSGRRPHRHGHGAAGCAWPGCERSNCEWQHSAHVGGGWWPHQDGHGTAGCSRNRRGRGK